MKFIESDFQLPFRISRIQYPLTLAYAITINKAQGQTLDFVALDLNAAVFAHGQLYVALSRVKEFNNIKIRVRTNAEQGNLFNDSGTYTKNIVYKEILVSILCFI